MKNLLCSTETEIPEVDNTDIPCDIFYNSDCVILDNLLPTVKNYFNIGDTPTVTEYSDAVGLALKDAKERIITIENTCCGETSGGGIESIVPGNGISVNNADPNNPVISADPVDLSGYVTLQTPQTIVGDKDFFNTTKFNDGILLSPSDSVGEIGYGGVGYSTSGLFYFKPSGTPGANFNLTQLTTDATYTFPNKSGTVALLDDIPTTQPTPSLQQVTDIGDTTTNTITAGGVRAISGSNSSTLSGTTLVFSEVTSPVIASLSGPLQLSTQRTTSGTGSQKITIETGDNNEVTGDPNLHAVTVHGRIKAKDPQEADDLATKSYVDANSGGGTVTTGFGLSTDVLGSLQLGETSGDTQYVNSIGKNLTLGDVGLSNPTLVLNNAGGNKEAYIQVGDVSTDGLSSYLYMDDNSLEPIIMRSESGSNWSTFTMSPTSVNFEAKEGSVFGNLNITPTSVTLPATTIAEVDAAGAKAVLTREAADQFYLGGSVTTGFGLSTNGSGELELGSPVSGENIQQVSIPEGNALLLGSYATENPALIVDNQYNEIHMQTGDTEINGVQSSIFMSSEPEFFNNIGLTVDTPTTSSELILTTDSSKLSYTGNTIEINGSGTTITGEVNVPTPTAGSHAATKAYVDANSGGVPLTPTLDEVLTSGNTSSKVMSVGNLNVTSVISTSSLTVASETTTGDLTASGVISSNGIVTSDSTIAEINAASPKVLPTKEWVETNYVKQESGTFIPDVVDTGGGATFTYTVQVAKYVKMGDIVNVTMVIRDIARSGTGTGSVTVNGLPFTATTPTVIPAVSNSVSGGSNRLSDLGEIQGTNMLLIQFEGTSNYLSASSANFVDGYLLVNGSYITS